MSASVMLLAVCLHRRWVSAASLVGFAVTLSVGDATLGNGMALLLLEAVRILAVQLRGGTDVCGDEAFGGLSSSAVSVDGGRRHNSSVGSDTFGNGTALLLLAALRLLAVKLGSGVDVSDGDALGGLASSAGGDGGGR